MAQQNITLTEIVSREEWLEERKKLLKKEKEFTRKRDELNAKRRRLPMVEIEKDYEFEGSNGEVSLFDMFEGRRQLIVYHFMWLWEDGKPLDKIIGATHSASNGCPAHSLRFRVEI